MKFNVKSIEVEIPNELILKKINTTPTLKRLFRGELRVGKNIENVNHFQFSEIVRFMPILGCSYKQLK